MASTYSSTLNLELQTTGENSGTWGTITNNNLQKLESAAKGYVSVAIASTSDALTATDGTSSDETSNAIIKLTGTLTGNTTMQCEAVENWYIVDNAATMGTYTLGFKPAGGISSAKNVLNYLILMFEELGDEWIDPSLFRIGASSLLIDIERQLYHYVLGRYANKEKMAIS